MVRQPSERGGSTESVSAERAEAMNDWIDAESHVERAHEHYEHGRWEDAELELREALSLNPYRPEWHFNLGLTLEAAGRFEEAVKAFKDCHELDGEDPQVALAVGTNMLRSDDYRGSIAWLERAGKLDPANVLPMVMRIEAHTRLDEHDQAELMFYMSQQVDPSNAEAHAAMAESLLSRNLIDKAIWCLREAASNDPGLPGVHSKLARAYRATGRHERARQLFLRELRQDPGDIDTLLDLGELLMDMNRLSEAGEKFRRVLELEPDNTDAHFRLAEVADREGQRQTALEHFDVVLRLDPAFPGVRRRLAGMLLRSRGPGAPLRLRDRRGSIDEQVGSLLDEELAGVRRGLEGAEGSGESAPTRAEVIELSHVMLDAGRAMDGRWVLSKLIARAPSDAEAMHLYAVACFRAAGRARDEQARSLRAEGVEVCRNVLRLDPRFVPAMHNLSVACVHEGQTRRARYWVNQALRIASDDPALKRLRFRLRLAVLSDAASGIGWLARALNPLRPTRRVASGLTH